MTVNLLDPAYLASPQCLEDLARLRRERPAFWHESGEGGFWAVLKYADVVAISNDPGTFSSSRGVFIYEEASAQAGALLYSDPPDHRRLRRYVTSHFMGRGISRLEPWIRKECSALVDRALARQSVEFISELAADLPLDTISEMMKLSQDERARLLTLSNEMAAAGASGGERVQRAVAAMSEFGKEVARRRRDTKGGDLVSAMLDVTDEEGAPLSDDEFGMMFMQIAGAATDTTKAVLGDIMLRFLSDPASYDALRADPANIRGFMEESLRMSPPLYYMRRTATRDVTLHNAIVRRGDRVVLYYLSANYDEDIFSAPHLFDPRRSPNPHLSFGTGEHVCLGLNIARLQIRVFLEELLKTVGRMELTGVVRLAPNTESRRIEAIPISLS